MLPVYAAARKIVSENGKDQAKKLAVPAGLTTTGGAALVWLFTHFSDQIEHLERELHQTERELIELKAAFEWVRQTRLPAESIPGYQPAPLYSLPE